MLSAWGSKEVIAALLGAEVAPVTTAQPFMLLVLHRCGRRPGAHLGRHPTCSLPWLVRSRGRAGRPASPAQWAGSLQAQAPWMHGTGQQGGRPALFTWSDGQARVWETAPGSKVATFCFGRCFRLRDRIRVLSMFSPTSRRRARHAPGQKRKKRH